MPRKAVTAAERARIERLLDKHGIDAADPERLEKLVRAMDGGGRTAGRPYGAAEDWIIIPLVGGHLARQKERGVARPSIRQAAINLAKKPPFNVWGMSAETIRKRHSAMLRRISSGEGLHPELQSLIQKYLESLTNEARQQGKQGEK